MLKIGVIGGGPSGVIFACQLKRSHPDYDISLFESSDRLMRRILISGNGRANFFNQAFINGKAERFFTNPSFIASLNLNEYASGFLKTLADMGFYYFADESGRMYPFANLSSSLKNTLDQEIKKLRINVYLDSTATAIDPRRKALTVNNNPFIYDKLFIATGGKAYDRDRLDNSSLFSSLGIKTNHYEPALCPVVTSKKINCNLVNCRLKGHLSLFKKEELIYEEDGEVLFKKDGLSGICVFDASLYIKEENILDYRITFSPFKHDNADISYKGAKKPSDMNGMFPYPIMEALKSINKDRLTQEDIIDFFSYSIKGKYSFKESQISLGGIPLDQIASDFSLRSNPDIIISGEALDEHAICGGFNMGFAFLSGYIAALKLVD